jgi:hypothetical protein
VPGTRSQGGRRVGTRALVGEVANSRGGGGQQPAWVLGLVGWEDKVVWWFETRITHNNFGYRGLEPELRFGLFEFGFFGYGFKFFWFGLWVSGNLPTHT